jgi:hypothetical protein
VPAESPFDFFVQRQNQRMVTLLEENHDVSRFVMAVLDHLEQHARAQGLRYADLRIEDPHVTPDGYIRARIR